MVGESQDLSIFSRSESISRPRLRDESQDVVFAIDGLSRGKTPEDGEEIVRFEQSDDQSNGGNSGSTEDILNSTKLGQLIPYSGHPAYSVEEDEVDYHLYIKMAPYPISLEEYIWSHDQRSTAKALGMKHCFHTLPAVRLLLGILDGVEYLHRQKIIHRDLKPANIFLAVLPPTEPDTPGYVDVSDCTGCGDESGKMRNERITRICPVIGDFGLIHELKDANPSTENEERSQPYPFSGQAGTRFYCPPIIPKANPICARLDVYSLGIIAFELYVLIMLGCLKKHR